MKTIYKNSLTIAFGILLGVFTASPASAQHGGGGGGSHSSSGGGGGGGSVSTSSSGGGGGGSRPSYSGGSVSSARPSSSGNAGYSRPSNSISAPVRSSGNVGIAPRGNYGYAPRANTPRGSYGYSPRTGTINSVPRQSTNGIGVARNNYGMAPRYSVGSRSSASGTGSVDAYRTSSRVGYNGAYNGGGYWGNHGYNYYNRGYYNSYYLPRLGFSCGVLPYGYYPFYFGDYQYYYSDGLYYQFDNNQYTVVEPPVGAEVTSVPDKAQSIVINGQQYYELNGVYYQAVTKDDGSVTYQIAGKDGTLNTNTEVQDNQAQGPQMGDIVAQLPQDCRKIKVNGQKLYVSPDGIYYQEQVDANGAKSYKVVGLPTDEPAQN